MITNRIVELAEAIHNHSVSAYEELYGIWWHKAYQMAFIRLRSAEDAEDVAQEVFTEIWAQRANIEPYNFTNWFSNIVNKACLRQMPARAA